jgi:hypothetical protein
VQESDRDARTRPLRDFAQLSRPFLSVWAALLTRCFCCDLPELSDEAELDRFPAAAGGFAAGLACWLVNNCELYDG